MGPPMVLMYSPLLVWKLRLRRTSRVRWSIAVLGDCSEDNGVEAFDEGVMYCNAEPIKAWPCGGASGSQSAWWPACKCSRHPDSRRTMKLRATPARGCSIPCD